MSVAGGLAAAAVPATAADTRPGTVSVSVAAKAPAAAGLRRAKVRVTAVRPASARSTRWTLPVSAAPTAAGGSVDLGGRLRFTRGKRSVTVTSLRLSLGAKPTISGTVGKRRVTLLNLSGTLERSADAIELRGARTSLTAAGARAVRSGLKLPRLAAGRLGTANVAVRVATVPTPPVVTPPVVPPVVVPPVVVPPVVPPVVEPPVVVPPTPQPPGPEPVCWVPTPQGSTDWVGCGVQTGGNLRSWTTYIGSSGVTVTGGAAITPSGSGLDHRFSVASTVLQPDDTVIITHAGGIRYFKSYGVAGDLDVWIRNLRLVVAADRKTASVVLDATYNALENPTAPPTEAADVTALAVDLTAARDTTTPEAGTTTYEIAPATLTAAGRAIWSNYYPAGAAFGAFTVTVPDVAVD